MYNLFKLIFRFFDYTRGFILLIIIRSCGGVCKSIPKVGKNVIFKYPPHKGIYIGKNCDIGAFSQFDIPPKGKLYIGDNVKFTQGVVISALNSVHISSNVLIAEWTSIRDSQHMYALQNKPINQQGMNAGEIFIDEDVWIGRNSGIFMDSFIHKGAIIGANSICKKIEIPSMKIFAGSPVKYIKDR